MINSIIVLITYIVMLAVTVIEKLIGVIFNGTEIDVEKADKDIKKLKKLIDKIWLKE